MVRGRRLSFTTCAAAVIVLGLAAVRRQEAIAGWYREQLAKWWPEPPAEQPTSETLLFREALPNLDLRIYDGVWPLPGLENWERQRVLNEPASDRTEEW